MLKFQKKEARVKKPLTADFFNASSKPLKFKRGEIILRPDSVDSGVFLIEKGFVKVYSVTEDGEEKIHLIVKSTEIFPLIWTLKGVNREVYYQAMSDLTVRKARKNDFLAFVKKDSEVLGELLGKVIAIADVYVSRIDTLEYTKSYPRLISRIIALSRRFGQKNSKGLEIEVPLTHSDIAASSNMTRETASREIETLVRKKLIFYSAKRLTILSMPKLKRELSRYAVKEVL